MMFRSNSGASEEETSSRKNKVLISGALGVVLLVVGLVSATMKNSSATSSNVKLQRAAPQMERESHEESYKIEGSGGLPSMSNYGRPNANLMVLEDHHDLIPPGTCSHPIGVSTVGKPFSFPAVSSGPPTPISKVTIYAAYTLFGLRISNGASSGLLYGSTQDISSFLNRLDVSRNLPGNCIQRVNVRAARDGSGIEQLEFVAADGSTTGRAGVRDGQATGPLDSEYNQNAGVCLSRIEGRKTGQKVVEIKLCFDQF